MCVRVCWDIGCLGGGCVLSFVYGFVVVFYFLLSVFDFEWWYVFCCWWGFGGYFVGVLFWCVDFY